MTGEETNRAVLQVDNFRTTVRLRRSSGTGSKPWDVVWADPMTADQVADGILAANGWARVGEWAPLFPSLRAAPIGSVVGAYHVEVERITGLE